MLICVTQRLLCPDDFLRRLEALVSGGTDLVILRETDLSEEDYFALARVCLAVCRRHGVRLALHGHPEAARRLDAGLLHLPFAMLRAEPRLAASFERVGTSVHGAEDAVFAEACGADYLLAGHVFETDCKPGLPGRGLTFLQEVCAAVKIPVYAIGGMRPDRLRAVRAAGAAGICVRSELMTCADPAGTVRRFQSGWADCLDKSMRTD